MTYGQRIDRRHPGCMIFLLDQSGSMAEPMGGQPSVSKAQALATAINDLLHSIVRRCVKDLESPPRHYYDLGIIGYSDEAMPLFGGPLEGRYLASVAEVAEVAETVQGIDGTEHPVWIPPVANNRTAMCAALDLAGQVAHGWIGLHGNSFPPIVFNISDGKATDGEPRDWAQRLRGLKTDDGDLLLFNIHLSATTQQPVIFPADAKVLDDDYSKRMFGLSSPLPDFMRRHAKERRIPVDPGARGFVCNGDMSTLIHALTVGTTLDQIAEY
jgi:hypothetical protein